MIRSALILLGIIVLIALSIGLFGDPGTASLSWMNYRIDTTATAAVILVGFMTLMALSFWNVVLWLARSPQRAERRRIAQRRKQADEALTRGFIAMAAGDAEQARRLAVKAQDLSDNMALVHILTALAAEESRDTTAIHAAYTTMLSVPDLRLAGLKGLTERAKANGDSLEAVRLATEAYSQAQPSPWAFRTLVDARLEAGAWSEAVTLVDGALSRKLISPLYAERARAGLMTATAARLETEVSQREQALDCALKAAKLHPAFTPAPVIAARLLQAMGKTGRAEDVLEAAWGAHPHPAIVIAYRDLMMTETPKERARRLQELVDRNPGHRESRLLQLERAILLNSAPDIAAAMSALEADAADDVITRRLCGLMAKAASALKEPETARLWLSRGEQARFEANWSDLDTDGKAFAYTDADWAAIISRFAESNELAHPRFDRGEKGLAELPAMPKPYVASKPFVKGTGRPATRTVPLQPDAVDSFGEAITGHDLDNPPET